MSKRAWHMIPAVIFFLCAAISLYSTYTTTTKLGGSELIGHEAPSLSTRAIEGYNAIPQKDMLFRYQYVLVNFFASWCTPCLAEHPHLLVFAKEYEVKIAGVAWRDSPEHVKTLLEQHGNPYDYLGTDLMDASAFAYGVEGLPESFLVDKEGKVVASFQGGLTQETIAQRFAPHVPKRSAAQSQGE